MIAAIELRNYFSPAPQRITCQALRDIQLLPAKNVLDLVDKLHPRRCRLNLRDAATDQEAAAKITDQKSELTGYSRQV